jgi:hypothetical protein
MFISPQEVLMGREVEYPLSPEIKANLDKLLIALNKFRAFYGKPMVVTSGYRPGKYNTAAKGAKNSSHLTCEACDFADPDGALDLWCTQHLDILEECGLWLESPQNTPGWTHLQIRPITSGNRVFIP